MVIGNSGNTESKGEIKKINAGYFGKNGELSFQIITADNLSNAKPAVQQRHPGD